MTQSFFFSRAFRMVSQVVPSRRRTIGQVFVMAISLAFVAKSLDADTILLRSGGELKGKVQVKREGNTITSYVMKLDAGGHIKLDPDQVKRHSKPTPADTAYAELLHAMPDTADSHWKMFEFCERKDLRDEKNFHLERTLELDPNHRGARKSQGYAWKDGRWIRQDEEMERRGYVRFRGNWHLPQHVATMERDRELELKQKEWRKNLKTWRGWLGGKRSDLAIENFQAIRDPLAAMGLIELIKREKDDQIRETLVSTLARLKGSNVTRSLVDIALFDVNTEIRIIASQHLADRDDPAYATLLLLPYLQDKNNGTINRAAVALGDLGHSDAILPLINALVTTHVRVVKPSGSIQTAFGSSPSGGSNGGLSVGQKEKKIPVDRQNRSVLASLVKLTNQNFQYAESDWLDWYKRNRTPESFNLRRDE